MTWKWCRARAKVAQIWNLLYRRISFGKALRRFERCRVFHGLRITNPRYSRLQICATFAVFIGALSAAQGALNVVSTLPDFASIAELVGGDRIRVTVLAKGTEDPHFVDARPSFIRILNKADLLLEGGADLEIGWLPPLVQNARNSRILGDASGHVLMSRGIRLLDVPTAPVNRAQGDVHPMGNPHYWLEPENGKIMAATVAEALKRMDRANTAAYDANVARFNKTLDEKLKQWTHQLEPYRGTKILTYHKTFNYFAERFGFQIVGQLEPKPGIEPSPTHINALIPKAKSEGVKLLLIETFRPRRTPTHVAEAIGAKLLIVPSSVGGHEKVKDYFDLFDYLVEQIVGALKDTK